MVETCRGLRAAASPSRVLAAAGAVLLPWTVVLVRTLPATFPARHWPLAWGGLDLALAAGALGTAALHRAGDQRAGLLAAATGTLALADLWFDVVTSAPGWPLAQALAAAVVELGFAGYCAGVALASLERARSCDPEVMTSTPSSARSDVA